MSDRQRYRDALTRQRDDRLMASRNPYPERITMALDAAGLWGPGVDRACGVEEPTVDLWESGERVPTREQVEALAALTGFLPVFFYQDVPGRVPVWLCGDDGCELVHPPTRPAPAGPAAGVVWLPGPGRLF